MSYYAYPAVRLGYNGVDMGCEFHITIKVKEAVQYYLNNGSDVAGCFLDATKAFNRIRYVRLFDLLLERQMSAIG